MDKPHNPSESFIAYHKDTEQNVQSIRTQVEKSIGKPISQLRKEYAEDRLFYLALRHATTTKKAICVALDIPVEGACRYKRRAEKDGLLVQSIDRYICPCTRHYAHLLTTNPTEFAGLRQSADTQQKLF